jgi:hypothetical protein
MTELAESGEAETIPTTVNKQALFAILVLNI